MAKIYDDGFCDMSGLDQLNFLCDNKSKEEIAIERIKTFAPLAGDQGYFLAFSGGKDSIVIKHLADRAGVKYDAHYNFTGIDPPELVRFIKQYYPDVSRDKIYDKDGKVLTMWKLIVRHRMPPIQTQRYCCEHFKEGGGDGRFKITGVRWAESVNRRNKRAGLEASNNKKKRHNYDPDNPDQELIHTCQTRRHKILNPIIDWETKEVWDYIKRYNIPYPSLYDEGWSRLGCIGCPMSNQAKEFERWPKFKQLYLRAFDLMIKQAEIDGKSFDAWKTAEDVMRWWTRGAVCGYNIKLFRQKL